jgi:phosphoenolpyruvate carboxylase
MVKEIKTYDAKMLTSVSRAFSHFLALSNAAENQNRVRGIRDWLLQTKSR